MPAAPSMVPADDARRRRLLDAAFGVFMRFGYRKTSMDEVARAADLSRQGLYLHFPSKEGLFLDTLDHALGKAVGAAAAHLGAAEPGLEDRLVAAFDAWLGPSVGLVGDTTDVFEVSHTLGGAVVARQQGLFAEVVTKALRASGLAAAYKPAGLTARQLTDTLYATARGLKELCASRADFGARIAVAARAICLPLRREK